MNSYFGAYILLFKRPLFRRPLFRKIAGTSGSLSGFGWDIRQGRIQTDLVSFPCRRTSCQGPRVGTLDVWQKRIISCCYIASGWERIDICRKHHCCALWRCHLVNHYAPPGWLTHTHETAEEAWCLSTMTSSHTTRTGMTARKLPCTVRQRSDVNTTTTVKISDGSRGMRECIPTGRCCQQQHWQWSAADCRPRCLNDLQNNNF